MEQPSTVWQSQNPRRHRVHRTIQSESCKVPGRHSSQCPCTHGQLPYNLAIQEETAAVWGSFETAKSGGASLHMCMLEPIWKDGQPMKSNSNPKFQSSINSAIQCLEAPGIQNTKVWRAASFVLSNQILCKLCTIVNNARAADREPRRARSGCFTLTSN